MLQVNPSLSEAGHSTVPPAEPFMCGSHGEGRGAAWISARGELDIASAPQFTHTFRQALDRALLVIIDLRDLTFIDSTGLHAIVDADARARQSGRRLVLIRGCEPVHRLFALVGLTDRLKIVDLTPSLAADPGRLVGVSGAAC